VFVFRKQQEEWRSRIPAVVLRYFLTNKISLLQIMYRYVHMIFIVKCVTVTHFFIAYAAF